MEKKNLFFDLDGTIIDSYPGISKGVKYAIEKMGGIPLADETLRKFIGPPLHDSFMKYLNCDYEKANQYVNTYREYYSVHGVYEFLLFDGIYDTVKELSKNFDLYVTTSKPKSFTEIILDKAGILEDFIYVSGGEVGKPDNSKQEVVTNVINKFSLNPESCILIGDTRFDGEGAQLMGIDFCAVTYGFGTKEELLQYNPVKIFDNAGEIKDYFLKVK